MTIKMVLRLSTSNEADKVWHTREWEVTLEPADFNLVGDPRKVVEVLSYEARVYLARQATEYGWGNLVAAEVQKLVAIKPKIQEIRKELKNGFV